MAIVNSTEVKEPWQTAPASSSITSGQIDGGTRETVRDLIVLGSISLQTVTAAMKLKDACSLEEKL